MCLIAKLLARMGNGQQSLAWGHKLSDQVKNKKPLKTLS